MLKVAEGKLKYHMSQNAMERLYSPAYVGFQKELLILFVRP